MRFKAAVFDLDGTLLNTLEDIADSINIMLSLHQFPRHSYETYKYLVGDGLTELVARALPEEERTPEMIKSCVAEAFKEYQQHWNIKTKLYKGIPELLCGLRNKGLNLTIVSNKPDELTQKTVKHYLSDFPFKIVIGESPKFPKKPDPESTLYIAKALNLHPSECVYFGDTSIDMKTARTAGMFAVGVLWGFRKARELAEYGANLLIYTPSDFFTQFEL